MFDTYKAASLKSATREERRQGKDPIQYQIRDDTSIKHIPMSRFLSHDKAKADLTEYLAASTLEYNKHSSKVVITSASGHATSNSELLFEDNNHEEADTLLNHYAVLASRRNPQDAKLESSRSTKSKVKVLSYRQGHLAASLPQSRWISRQGFADAFGCH